MGLMFFNDTQRASLRCFSDRKKKKKNETRTWNLLRTDTKCRQLAPLGHVIFPFFLRPNNKRRKRALMLADTAVMDSLVKMAPKFKFWNFFIFLNFKTFFCAFRCKFFCLCRIRWFIWSARCWVWPRIAVLHWCRCRCVAKFPFVCNCLSVPRPLLPTPVKIKWMAVVRLS